MARAPKLPAMKPTVAFIGGGNMASGLIGGLVRSGLPVENLIVIEPAEAQRERLQRDFGVQALPFGSVTLMSAHVVVWAVKPQAFAEAAAGCNGLFSKVLHLSVMAGIRCSAIAQAANTTHVVRAMPNTPALIGRGIAGLFATPEVTAAERDNIERLLAPTGQVVWLEAEEQLDAVTALSGSGPAYVYYFIEAMMAAAAEMGLSPEQGRQLAQATFEGAAAMSALSPLHPSELRAQVTSKGGTTHAAISMLDEHAVKATFVKALHAARQRAQELGAQ